MVSRAHSAVQVGDDLWIVSPGDAIDDAINHSCEPNIGFVTGEPVFHALREIAPGEELTWDYSTSLMYRRWRLECCCRSPLCRGIVQPFPLLGQLQQARLLPISLRYIRRWASQQAMTGANCLAAATACGI
jgi:hypothetical protein